MIRVYYSERGTSFSDFNVEETLRGLIRHHRDHPDGVVELNTSTENALDCMRALIAEGEVGHDEVEFVYLGQNLGHASRDGSYTSFVGPERTSPTDRFIDRILNVKFKLPKSGE